MPEVALPAATIDYRESGPKDSAFPPGSSSTARSSTPDCGTHVAARLCRHRAFAGLYSQLPLGSHSIPVNDRSAT